MYRSNVGFAKTLDGAIAAVSPKKENWVDDYPDLKTKLAEMYDKYPAAGATLALQQSFVRMARVKAVEA